MATGKEDTSPGLSNWLSNLANQLQLAWWVEVVTAYPRCTYYFGPFLSSEEAHAAKSGYVEDLEREGAASIVVTVKRCKPKDLTIFEDTEPQRIPSLSGRFR